MSVWSQTSAEARRERFWRTAPKNPAREAAKRGHTYFRRGIRMLDPHASMPCGEHQGKLMRAVPLDYLLWVDAQPWSQHWDPWPAVHDYLNRYVRSDADTQDALPDLPTPTFYLGPPPPVSPSPRLQVCSTLHCLPGHEDLLHALAVGALNLSRDWYQPGRLPHYDLAPKRHDHALRLGAVLIEDTQLMQHQNTWLEFYRSKPQFADLPTPPRLPARRL